MLTSIKTILVFITYVGLAVDANSVKGAIPNETRLLPSHDTFVQRDIVSKSHGKGSKITVTQHGSNQRIGLMTFDTSNYDVNYFDENNVKAHLQLSVAETHESKPVRVKVLRLDNQFHEDLASWENFDGMAEGFVEFTVESSHVNHVGQVDVSALLKPGMDTTLAFVIEDQGYVKFHSKEYGGDANNKPSLIITHGNEL